MNFMKNGLTAALLMLGLILIAPLAGCREEAPKPENRPLTQKELEESLDRPGKFTTEAMESWDAGKAKREADMKAYKEELKRKEAEAQRQREEFRKKHPQPGTDN